MISLIKNALLLSLEYKCSLKQMSLFLNQAYQKFLNLPHLSALTVSTKTSAQMKKKKTDGIS